MAIKTQCIKEGLGFFTRFAFRNRDSPSAYQMYKRLPIECYKRALLKKDILQ